MNKIQLIFLVLAVSLFASKIHAQYPHYFLYDIEKGLPSNEVYSVIQDKRGFIWIGCDVGLYKFDGVKYTLYKSKSQNSKSISNLTLSDDGKIFCANFQDQIFYLENDTLKELQHTFQKISNITITQKGILYINHSRGISIYNAQNKVWENLNNIEKFTRNFAVSPKGEVYSLTENKIIRITEQKVAKYTFPDSLKSVASEFLLVSHNDSIWVFKKDGSVIYTFQNEGLRIYNNTKLNDALRNRKITNLKSFPDNNLWIFTYNGVVNYNSENDTVTIFYPELSFSDMLIDREENYWFSTLQAGLLRVPNLNFIVWNSPAVENEKLTHLATDGTHIYFSSVNGTIGKLNSITNTLNTFLSKKKADIECLLFDSSTNSLIFHSQNENYILKDDKSGIVNAPFQNLNAVKSIVHVPPFYFLGSSQGLYVENESKTTSKRDKISEIWTRQLVWNDTKNELYAATNKGLRIYTQQEDRWICSNTFYDSTQIVSIDLDNASQFLYSISFDGRIYGIDLNLVPSLIAELPYDVQAYKLKYYQNSLFVASNKGVWIYDLEKGKWLNFNALSGLASENINDIILLNEYIWLASGKGLQKIPFIDRKEGPKARIYLRAGLELNKLDLVLNYNQPLTIYPEVSCYSSNGQFEYAYQINQNEWLKLPSSIGQIEVQNLPTGEFELTLKVIDHLGRDSENSVMISGFVKPPFWKTWWFISLFFIVSIGLVYRLYRNQISKHRKELERQNELNIARLTAIRSQMNPHFIFNSLNSIQDLILQKKTVESYDYVVLFSELVRNALTYSTKDFISIKEEIEFLDTYLQLEKLRFKNDFFYKIEYDESEEFEVPSLMIQPFIENALFHGLLHIEGRKELQIRFQIDDNILVCYIEDNGIGRKQADTIYRRQGGKHSSFALEAIQKRLNIINEQHGKNVGIFYLEDIWPHKKNTGTRVVIQLPYRRIF